MKALGGPWARWGLLGLWGLWLAPSACTPMVSCTEVGCNYELVCNAASGQCERPELNCQVVGCAAGFGCDASTGVCRAEAASCRMQSCARGQTCNTQTGYCETARDCQRQGCASVAQLCDAISGQCVARDCQVDGDCPQGHLCSDTRVCQPGCRPLGAPCPAGQYCWPYPVNLAEGQCLSLCARDGDCGHDQVCQATSRGGQCQPRPGCARDGDCATGEQCQLGRCTPPSCLRDDQCPAPLVCDRATGRCTAEACAEDVFSPNHTPTQAHAAGLGSYAGLMLCPGRSDWFGLNVRAGEALGVSLWQPEGQAAPDVYLYEDVGQVVRLDQRPGASRSLEYVSPRAQNLLLEVRSPLAKSVRYDAEMVSRDARFCSDDSLEENDRQGQATPLPYPSSAPSELTLSTCPNDPDWLVLRNVRPHDGLRLWVQSWATDVEAALYDPSGTRHTLRANEELRWVRAGTGGDYYLRVASPASLGRLYRVLYQSLPTWACPGAGSQALPRLALELLPSATHRTSICTTVVGWDTHWYRLAVPDGRMRLEATLRPVSGAPAIELALLSGSGQAPSPMRVSRAQADGTHKLAAAVEPGATLWLRVTSDEAPGRVVQAPAYEVDYRMEALAAESVDAGAVHAGEVGLP